MKENRIPTCFVIFSFGGFGEFCDLGRRIFEESKYKLSSVSAILVNGRGLSGLYGGVCQSRSPLVRLGYVMGVSSLRWTSLARAPEEDACSRSSVFYFIS